MINKIWDKMDGKKFLSGVGLSLIGVLMFNWPPTAPAAPYVLGTGLNWAGFGYLHKIYKKNNKESK